MCAHTNWGRGDCELWRRWQISTIPCLWPNSTSKWRDHSRASNTLARCLLGWSWVRWFHICHPHLTLHVVQKLEMGRARGLCLKNVQSIYNNLKEMYGKHNYPPSQIWNADESNAQVVCNGRALVLPYKV